MFCFLFLVGSYCSFWWASFEAFLLGAEFSAFVWAISSLVVHITTNVAPQSLRDPTGWMVGWFTGTTLNTVY